MKILLVLKSKHVGNTRKIAEAMAEAAPVTIADVENINNYNLKDYNIVGFGSGIYFGKHDKKLIEFAGKLCDKKAYTFVFSTMGGGEINKNHRPLISLLENKNKIVLGSFSCKAFDKYGPFKLIGGINKGRPNADDFKEARNFILDVIKKYESLEGKA